MESVFCYFFYNCGVMTFINMMGLFLEILKGFYRNYFICFFRSIFREELVLIFFLYREIGV